MSNIIIFKSVCIKFLDTSVKLSFPYKNNQYKIPHHSVFLNTFNKIKFNLSLAYSPHKNIYSSDFENCRHELRKNPGKASLRMIISQGTQSLTRSLQRCKFARRSIAHLRSYLAKEVPFASDACCAHTINGGLVARPRICTITSHLATPLLPCHGECTQECYNAIAVS